MPAQVWFWDWGGKNGKEEKITMFKNFYTSTGASSTSKINPKSSCWDRGNNSQSESSSCSSVPVLGGADERGFESLLLHAPPPVREREQGWQRCEPRHDCEQPAAHPDTTPTGPVWNILSVYYSIRSPPFLNCTCVCFEAISNSETLSSGLLFLFLLNPFLNLAVVFPKNSYLPILPNALPASIALHVGLTAWWFYEKKRNITLDIFSPFFLKNLIEEKKILFLLEALSLFCVHDVWC